MSTPRSTSMSELQLPFLQALCSWGQVITFVLEKSMLWTMRVSLYDSLNFRNIAGEQGLALQQLLAYQILYRSYVNRQHFRLRFFASLPGSFRFFNVSFPGPRFLQSCIAMLKRLESFMIHVINVITNTIERYFM